MTTPSPLKYLKSTTGQTLAVLAGLTLITGCQTTSSAEMSLVSAEQSAAKPIGEMVLEAQTSSTSAKALYTHLALEYF